MENTCPYHALVPYGPSREPGLILLSMTGEIRFWDNIGIGLAGGDHYTLTLLELVGLEYISNFIRADVSCVSYSHTSLTIFPQAQIYVATTSTGRLFRLIITSSGGKIHLNSHIFARPAPSLTLTNFLPSLWSSAPSLQPEIGNISAVALGETKATGKEIWALVDTRVQKWNMSVEGWEEVMLDVDVGGLLRGAIRGNFDSAPEDNIELDLELVDIAVERCGFITAFFLHPSEYSPLAQFRQFGHSYLLRWFRG